jgi:uncharacterized cofD-like protein
VLKPHVVAVGGGHGLAATIRAGRRYAGRTTAVVATADDGGSTGRLRDAMAMPAPGDVRHCLVAMAGDGSGDGSAPPEAEPTGEAVARAARSEAAGAASMPRRAGATRRQLLADALEFRFDGTDVAGHALGNLLLAGLTAVTGDFLVAVDEASRLLGLDPDVARVLPATVTPVVLRATVSGTHSGEVTGQVAISRAGGIERVGLEPGGARAPRAAVEALVDADQIVLGPGSLFTSVLAAAVVDDVRQALADSPAQLVYVCNLRAEGTETFGYDVAAHVAALQRHGIEPDVVVTHAGGLPLGGRGAGTRIQVVVADVARPHGRAHDSARLAGVLAELVP